MRSAYARIRLICQLILCDCLLIVGARNGIASLAGRKKNNSPTRRVDPKIPSDAYACIQYLVGMGRYGSNANEVARYLVLREIDELTRTGVLPKDLGLKGAVPDPATD